MERLILDVDQNPDVARKPVPTLKEIYNTDFNTATVENLEQIILHGICISTVMIDSISSRAKNLKNEAPPEELITLDLIENKINKIMSLLHNKNNKNISIPGFSANETKYLCNLRNITGAAQAETSILQALPSDLLKFILDNIPLHLRASKATVSKLFNTIIDNSQIEPMILYKMFVIFTDNLKYLEIDNNIQTHTYGLLKKNKNFHQFFKHTYSDDVPIRHAKYAHELALQANEKSYKKMMIWLLPVLLAVNELVMNQIPDDSNLRFILGYMSALFFIMIPICYWSYAFDVIKVDSTRREAANNFEKSLPKTYEPLPPYIEDDDVYYFQPKKM